MKNKSLHRIMEYFLHFDVCHGHQNQLHQSNLVFFYLWTNKTFPRSSQSSDEKWFSETDVWRLLWSPFKHFSHESSSRVSCWFFSQNPKMLKQNKLFVFRDWIEDERKNKNNNVGQTFVFIFVFRSLCFLQLFAPLRQINSIVDDFAAQWANMERKYFYFPALPITFHKSFIVYPSLSFSMANPNSLQ